MKVGILKGLLVGIPLIVAIPAFAHHSFAMFDNTKLTTIKGSVTAYRWENPHMHIIVQVPPAADTSSVGVWDVEGASINIMARQGWTKISYKIGDPIVAVGHPLKTGDKGLSLSYVILPDGSHMYMNEARPDAPVNPAPNN